LKGRAKDLIEILEVQDFEKTDVLALIWQVYDQAFERMAHERLNDVHDNWEKAHRRPGTPMQDWCNELRRLLFEMKAQDPGTTISDEALAVKMLRGSGLVKKEKAQVLFNAGGLMESDKIETVLKITHGDIQIAERRSGQAVHQKHDHRQERGRDQKPKYHNKFKPHRKP